MTERTAKPPYTSYRSFTNLISELRDANVLPGVIDRSFLSKRSGSEQSALIATLKWFGLIDETDAPTQRLRDFIAADEESFKAQLKTMVEDSYSLVTDGTFNLSNATTAMMADQFRQYGISGSTLTKSVSFFLAAAQAAGIDVSPHVKPPQPGNGSTRKRPKAVAQPPLQSQEHPPTNKPTRPPREGMVAIPIPIFGGKDGVIYLPGDMTESQWASVIKMTEFILQNYRDTMGTEPSEGGES